MPSRVRNRNKETPVMYKHCRLDGSLYTSQAQNFFDNESMSDIVTPSYHRRIASGEIINNPCGYTRERLHSSCSSSYRAVHVTNPNFGYKECGDSSGSLTYYLASASSLLELDSSKPLSDRGYHIAKAKADALGGIDSTPYKFMEDAFELRETLRYLRNPLGAMKNLAKSFRKDVKGHKAFKGDHTKAIADVWLSYRFGFSPLLRSTMDAVEVVNNGLQRLPERRTARGFSSTEETDVPFQDATAGHSQLYFTQTRSASSQIRAGVLYEVDNPISNLSSNLGFRMKDIPETLWAVVPYSFMVDRVANVSGFIRGVTNLLDPNVTILAGWVTTKDSQLTITRATKQVNSSYTISMEGDPVEFEKFSYTRTPWDPTIGDTVPPVNFGGLVDDATKTLDLIDLVRSRIRF